jgi:hypothetical protein
MGEENADGALITGVAGSVDEGIDDTHQLSVGEAITTTRSLARGGPPGWSVQSEAMRMNGRMEGSRQLASTLAHVIQPGRPLMSMTTSVSRSKQASGGRGGRVYVCVCVCLCCHFFTIGEAEVEHGGWLHFIGQTIGFHLVDDLLLRLYFEVHTQHRQDMVSRG